ncbi:transporter substrate-binding domain-containing protein [Thioclava nitratireducens]|uniref:transporter substrate-binding domain-containing protein n=1 Tax=Thioclava nitratireducens TaxID=1915078 RepID=UPI00248153F3|nr:transporter substrate-binding domain-containing protein [Thioclava nitratireducens]WGT48896.1 transporter substrate-binding domain-containing protein [Thioclava nitratireducens]
MKFLKTVATAALTVGALMAGHAQATTLDQVEKTGVLKVGMLVDFPPFGLMGTSGKPEGYDADTAKALADYLGTKIEIVPVTGPNRIPYLLSGQVDVLVASLGITPERAKRVDFSRPYAGIEIMVYGKKEEKVSKPADLSGESVGVVRASTQDAGVTKVAPDDTTIRRFDDDAAAVQALLSGQVPLIGVSNVVAAQIAKAAPGRFDEKFPLSSQVQGIAVEPGADKLLAKINAFVGSAMKDGTMDKISQQWLATDIPDFVRNGSAEEAATPKSASN